MIVLKTYSQVVNFLRRMNKKYAYYHSEGCGCCWQQVGVEVDTEKRRVLIVSFGEHKGERYTSCEVLAVIKK